MFLKDVNTIFIPVSFEAKEFTLLEFKVAGLGVDSTQVVSQTGLDRHAKVFNRLFDRGTISIYAADVCGRNDVSTIIHIVDNCTLDSNIHPSHQMLANNGFRALKQTTTAQRQYQSRHQVSSCSVRGPGPPGNEESGMIIVESSY